MGNMGFTGEGCGDVTGREYEYEKEGYEYVSDHRRKENFAGNQGGVEAQSSGNEGCR